MIIITTLLFCICLILGFCLFKKHKVDKETELKNKELAQTKNRLTKEVQELTLDKAVIRKEILVDEKERCKLNNDLNNLRNNINITLNQNKEISDNAFQEYEKTLEQAYIEAELSFDKRAGQLWDEMDSIQKELDTLKATRAAAHEALLKEKEIKDNKDNYRLLPSQSDLADARRLEVVKRELNKPRILSMLIWKTYYQPIAQKQFPIILKAKTKCGIYKITNIITEECYIGQAVNLYRPMKNFSLWTIGGLIST